MAFSAAGFAVLLLLALLSVGCRGNPDAKRLYDDLISRYNKLVRPVVNDTDPLTVKIKLKLSQLIEVVRPFTPCIGNVNLVYLISLSSVSHLGRQAMSVFAAHLNRQFVSLCFP